MASNIINVTEICEVNGGPKISEVVNYTCDSYEVIEVVVSAGAADDEIVLQGVGSEMSLLQVLVPSGVYGVAPYITYKLNADSNLAIDLTNMHLFVGRGAIQALMEGVASAEITKLFLSNAHTADVTVQI